MDNEASSKEIKDRAAVEAYLASVPLILDPRERAQISHAVVYANNHAAAGVPGHSQFILIAKLAQKLGLA